MINFFFNLKIYLSLFWNGDCVLAKVVWDALQLPVWSDNFRKASGCVRLEDNPYLTVN